MSEPTRSAENAVPERDTWMRCTGSLFGALSMCRDGRLRPWRGTDGHNGSEMFYTCDRCGRTS